MPCALVFAFASAGNNSPARIAMIAMTTSNSIKVNATTETILLVRNLLTAIRDAWLAVDNRNASTTATAVRAAPSAHGHQKRQRSPLLEAVDLKANSWGSDWDGFRAVEWSSCSWR